MVWDHDSESSLVRVLGAIVPPPTTMLPALVLFVAIGVVCAVFPERMYDYARRHTRFWAPWRKRVMRGLPDHPGSVRLFGVLYAMFAVVMLALYLWQWFHQ